jgi:lysophospholipase L1-like esterase
MAMQNRPKMRFRNLAYIIYLILFTFFALEIILRIYNPFHARIKGDKVILPANQTYYYHNNKIASLDKEIRVRYNSLGFQGPEKPANFDSCLSIVTVGGSTTACMYISTEDTWPALLSKELSRSFKNVWLNNAGRDGHSSFGHMFMMRDHLLKLHPRVIIFLTGINDVDRTDLSIHEDSVSHNFREFAMRNSEVLNIVLAYLRSRKAISLGLLTEFTDFKVKKKYTLTLSEDTIRKALRLQEPMVKGYERRMRALIDTCLAHNIKPVLVTQPMLCGNAVDTLSGMNLATVRIMQGGNGLLWSRKLDLYNNVLKQLAAEYNLFCIDLAAVMPKSTKYYYDFVHYNKEGTKKMAELMAPQLEGYLKAQFPDFTYSK